MNSPLDDHDAILSGNVWANEAESHEESHTDIEEAEVSVPANTKEEAGAGIVEEDLHREEKLTDAVESEMETGGDADDDDDFADFEEYHERQPSITNTSPIAVKPEPIDINVSQILSDIWSEYPPLQISELTEEEKRQSVLDVKSPSNTYTNPRKLMNQLNRPMRQFVGLEAKPDPVVRWRASAVEGEVLKILQQWREKDVMRSRSKLFGWSHKRSSSLGPKKQNKSYDSESGSDRSISPPVTTRTPQPASVRPSSVFIEPIQSYNHILSPNNTGGSKSDKSSPPEPLSTQTTGDTIDNVFGVSAPKKATPPPASVSLTDQLSNFDKTTTTAAIAGKHETNGKDSNDDNNTNYNNNDYDNDDDDDWGDFQTPAEALSTEQKRPPPNPQPISQQDRMVDSTVTNNEPKATTPSPPVSLGPIQPNSQLEKDTENEQINSIVNSLPDLSFISN